MRPFFRCYFSLGNCRESKGITWIPRESHGNLKNPREFSKFRILGFRLGETIKSTKKLSYYKMFVFDKNLRRSQQA
jgi:hypothetical protein